MEEVDSLHQHGYFLRKGIRNILLAFMVQSGYHTRPCAYLLG